jgi:hypothetical protein
MTTEKGKFAVMDFKIYQISCSWRTDKICGTYGRENNTKCDRKNCPFVLYFFDEITVDEIVLNQKKEPYKVPDYVV